MCGTPFSCDITIIKGKQRQREWDKRRESPPGSSSFSRLASLFRYQTTSVSVFLSSAVHPSFKAVLREPLRLNQTPVILFTSSPIKSAQRPIPPCLSRSSHIYFSFFFCRQKKAIRYFLCWVGQRTVGQHRLDMSPGLPWMGKKHGVKVSTSEQATVHTRSGFFRWRFSHTTIQFCEVIRVL